MPETARRYWLLEKHTIRAKNEQGETCTLFLDPGECITLTSSDPPPDRRTKEMTHE